MNKKVIKLSENDLHQIVESVVSNIIAEGNMDEGLFDTIRSFGSQYGKRAAKKGEEMGAAASEKMRQGFNAAKNAASNAVEKGKQFGTSAVEKGKSLGAAASKKMRQGYDAAQGAVKNMSNDVKGTWNNAKQDGYAKDMRKAFEKFRMAAEKFQQSGGKLNGQFNSRIKGLENMLNAYVSHS